MNSGDLFDLVPSMGSPCTAAISRHRKQPIKVQQDVSRIGTSHADGYYCRKESIAGNQQLVDIGHLVVEIFTTNEESPQQFFRWFTMVFSDRNDDTKVEKYLAQHARDILSAYLKAIKAYNCKPLRHYPEDICYSMPALRGELCASMIPLLLLPPCLLRRSYYEYLTRVENCPVELLDEDDKMFLLIKSELELYYN